MPILNRAPVLVEISLSDDKRGNLPAFIFCRIWSTGDMMTAFVYPVVEAKSKEMIGTA